VGLRQYKSNATLLRVITDTVRRDVPSRKWRGGGQLKCGHTVAKTLLLVAGGRRGKKYSPRKVKKLDERPSGNISREDGG